VGAGVFATELSYPILANCNSNTLLECNYGEARTSLAKKGAADRYLIV